MTEEAKKGLRILFAILWTILSFFVIIILFSTELPSTQGGAAYFALFFGIAIYSLIFRTWRDKR
jgi:hypothetical protein